MSIHVVGRLARPAKFIQNANSTLVFMTVAQDRSYPDSAGNYGTDYLDFKWFIHTDKLLNFAQQNLTQGNVVIIDAEFQNNNHEVNGQMQYDLDMVIQDINTNVAAKPKVATAVA